MWGCLGHFYQRRASARLTWVWTLQWEGDVALLQCLPLSQRRA